VYFPQYTVSTKIVAKVLDFITFMIILNQSV
jgi:hypothetical protein